MNTVPTEISDLTKVRIARGLHHFQSMFLQRFADTLHLPYSAFSMPSGWTVYGDIRMDDVRVMIRRAASKRAFGFRGWQRKLKRARRLQRELCRNATSNLWFEMQWAQAVLDVRRYQIEAAWKESDQCL